MKRRAAVIFPVCYLAYMLIYVARLNLTVAAPGLKEQAVLTTQQIGFLGSAFSVIYACGRLLCGGISDRTAPWKMICLGLVLCGTSNLLIGLLPPFAAFLLLWSVNAFAQSLLWGANLRILSAVYPEEVARRRASYLSSAIASGSLASILLNSALIKHLGLRWAFVLPGLLTLAVSVLIVLAARDITPPAAKESQPHAFLALRNPALRRLLAPALIHGVMKDNISLWMAVYVMESFGVDLQSSSAFILLVPALGLLGRLLAPSLWRLCGSRDAALLAASFAVCAVCALALVALPLNAAAAVVLLSLIYMAVSVINACLLSIVPIRFAQEGLVASVSGLMDFATYLGTGLSAAVYGAVIRSFGYPPMFLSWAVLSLIMALAIRVLQNRRKRI